MEQRHLGRSGLAVSRLGLGTMTWGGDTNPDDAADQLTTFVSAGGSLIDTADVYCGGDSERVIGDLIRDLVDRDDLVIATKAVLTAEGARDASRRHLLRALDASLDRLGVDNVDLWQLHAYDPRTPLEETLSALDEAVSSGRARYAGVSNYGAWQLATAATWQRAWPGRTPVISTQVEYSLLRRDVEDDVVPASLELGVGLLPSSPLGRGVLTGKYRTGIPADSRAAAPHYADFVQPYLNERAARIVESVSTAAEGLGVSPLAVALCWVRDQPGVVAPIVGARTAGQLAVILETEQITLPGEIRDALDDISSDDD
ncbi:aldo/keto reductase [Actinomadura sp. DC4]|uniref:aldo/keto reductase n=1 Tax=Actinomadura sp. DC4 TaxID=3055069 RepID=UPI0025AF6542|nr:aldo/keto reductase [Actinomadura sp. DC4]MDN3355273.1 aldo/keto reductase [Actinomadura sp. DC4]